MYIMWSEITVRMNVKLETAPDNGETAPEKLQNMHSRKLFSAPDGKSLFSSPALENGDNGCWR